MAVTLRRCDFCGKPYEAKRPNSRFDSATCRKRASRAGSVAPTTPIRPGAPGDEPTGRPLTEAVRGELEQARRLDTALGQAAVGLAARIDGGTESGSAVAALNRELRATLEAATRGAVQAASPLDELRERRLRRLGA